MAPGDLPLLPYANGTQPYWIDAAFWMREHLEIPTIAGIVYLVAVFGGQYLMDKRSPLNVRAISIVWNGALAIYSLISFKYYVLDSSLPTVLEHGLHHEFCHLDAEVFTPWSFYFGLSKIPELFDTCLHVAKKQKVILLHWYHHFTVMWFCWIAWAYLIQNGGIFGAMNMTVHSLMYTYYTLSACGLRFPNAIRASITALQLIQMIVGLLTVVHNIIYCNYNPNVQLAGLLMYLSYALLFAQFFHAQYLTKRPEKATNGAANGSATNGHKVNGHKEHGHDENDHKEGGGDKENGHKEKKIN